jgi:hypothetical protein
MGDGTTTDAYEPKYNFANTPPLNLCGASTVPAVLDIKICTNTTVNINTSFVGVIPIGQTLHWYSTSTRDPGTEVLAPFIVGTGTYYAFFEGDCPNPPFSVVIISNISPSDPAYSNCVCFVTPSISTGTNTKIGITLLKRAGTGNSDNWPMIRKSGHLALESNTKGFVITRLTKIEIEGQTTPIVIPAKITNPQEGMMVYDKTDTCLKIYSDGQWKCFTTPACP